MAADKTSKQLLTDTINRGSHGGEPWQRPWARGEAQFESNVTPAPRGARGLKAQGRSWCQWGEGGRSCVLRHPRHVRAGESWEEPDCSGMEENASSPSPALTLFYGFFHGHLLVPLALSFRGPRREKG